MASMRHCTGVALGSCLAALAAFAHGGELSADEIVARSYAVDSGDDMSGELEFTFQGQGEPTTRTVLFMAYKNYHGDDDVDSKLVMFTEFPPDKRDVAFLAWFYPAASGRQHDMWLYLPELRTVRKMGGMHDHSHHHDDDGDETYRNSELDHEELAPRPPRLDHHRLVGTDSVEGVMCYMVESVPIDPKTSAYARRVTWITQDRYLPVRIEYYAKDDGVLVKEQHLSWRQIGHSWLWDEVSAINLRNGRHTRLVQSNVKINSGLPDNLFTKRILKQGLNALRGRLGEARN